MKCPGRSAAALLLLLVTGAACQVTETRRPIYADDSEVRVAAPARVWEIASPDEAGVGVLIFFEARNANDSFYMVRNEWHQDLGLIDAFGRAYRYLPHHREPAWTGSGTVHQGVARILELEAVTLVEIPFAEGERMP